MIPLAAAFDWAVVKKILPPFSWSSTGDLTEACPIGNVRLTPPIDTCRKIIAPRKKAWEQSLGGEEAARPSIRARLAGWPERLLVDRQGLPKTDEEFLWRLARDAWRGLDEMTDRENGLPVDHVFFGDPPAGTAEGRVGDYTSGTNIGLHLVAVAAAYELDLLPRPQATDRIRRILDTLQGLETDQGFLFNFYDTTSLERSSNFVSFVDTSWLTAGLMVARMAFPELADRCTRLIAEMNYRAFYEESVQQMSHGYCVDPRVRSRYHYRTLYTEARLGSLIAIGKGDVPDDHWFAMVRSFPTGCGWQTLPPKGTRRKRIRGHAFAAGYYEWKELRYIPSWGGSMFEALMPALLLDEVEYAPRSLGANDRVHALVQRRYALDEIGYPVWGISSSATPSGDGYAEYGISVLGTLGYPAGAVTPYASALALGVMPDAATANLRRLADLYDLYGEYGFYDAVDPRTGKVAYKYLTLDQSMLFIALANHLKDHAIQKRFAADPIVQRVLPMIGEEDFFE